jgi:hypothetical protein
MKIFYRNEYLFSEIYLREITQIEEDPAVKATLSALKEYREYADTTGLDEWNSSFVHEILKALRFGVRKVDENTALLYQLGSDSTITLCYSLLPSEDLDSTTMGWNWAEKIVRNLRDNQLKWGILTNGDCWRIYHTEEPTPYENYLEIDLKGIMDGEDVQQYQLFNKFMKAENFVPDKDGYCQFDVFKKDSQDRINYIEEELKNALKQKEEGGKGILSNLCMGYVEYLREEENPDFSDALCSTIYAGAILYMFRLLFLFYAKARGLLKEVNHELFSNVLLAAQKTQEQGDAGEDEYSLWSTLRELFSNIDLTYNGGLFNPSENEFVEEHRVSNTYLAPVIYYMTFYRNKAGSQKPISYRDMAVRHLGSLYEGLLEHKLFVSDEDTEVKVTKKEIKFVPASKGGKIVEGKYIPAGQVYFGNDKGMRKASGSYYTPEYIVDYIVQNTVGKKLEELKDAFLVDNKETIASIETAINESEKEAFIGFLIKNIDEFIQEKVLNLSILDPAMGSAHFLVNVVNLIANFLTEFCNSFGVIAEKDTSTTYWRRRVVENCIYGVDINPLAVELAKLSLWILTMAKDQPLSFLDHHLKCGNSLIGTRLSDVGKYPFKKEKHWKNRSQLGLFENDQNFKFAVENALRKYQKIETNESKELGDVGDKKQWLEEIHKVLKPYKAICDFHTNVLVANNFSEDKYGEIIGSFSDDFYWDGATFFHWELEFPKIILKDNGFDVTIGNPPYVGQKGNKELFRILKKTLLGKRFHQRRMDLYYFFFHLGLDISKPKGLVSYITPNYYLTATYADILRKDINNRASIMKLINFSELKVFESAAGQHNLITVLSKTSSINSIAETAFVKRTGSASKETFESILNQNDEETNYYYIQQADLYDGDDLQIRITGLSGGLDDPVQGVLNKIMDQGFPLGEICNLNAGIQTGADRITRKHLEKYELDAQIGDGIFVLMENRIQKLQLNDEELSILKPWYKNSDIKQWFTASNSDQKLIYYTNKNIYNYTPNLNRHFEKFKIVLINRNVRSGKVSLDDYENFTKGLKNISYVMIASAFRRGDYFCVSYARDIKNFISPKIIVPQRSKINTFGYNEIPWFARADVYFITGKDENISLKYILSLLNSKLYYAWLYHRGKRKGEVLELYLKPLSEIPIKGISTSKQQNFISLVDKILLITQDDKYVINSDKQTQVKEYQEQVDHLVYKLYGLSDEEISLVEDVANHDC